jgi:hypothetical protein
MMQVQNFDKVVVRCPGEGEVGLIIMQDDANEATDLAQFTRADGTVLMRVDRNGNIGPGVGVCVIHPIKAGTPNDGDFLNPQDGMVVVDSAANKIWTRIGGVWKGVVVA